MSGQFYVERQCWARWPKVLVMCKETGDGTERRRYIPEGGTRDEWNARVRENMRKLEASRKELDARLHEESELPNLRAEVDGLKWAVGERDALIRDMFRELRGLRDDGVPTDCMEHEARMRDMGIEEGDGR